MTSGSESEASSAPRRGKRIQVSPTLKPRPSPPDNIPRGRRTAAASTQASRLAILESIVGDLAESVERVLRNYILLGAKDLILELRVLTRALKILSRVLLVRVFTALTRVQLFTVLIKLNLVPTILTRMLMLIKVPLVPPLPKVMLKGLSNMINPNQQVHKLQERIYVIH